MGENNMLEYIPCGPTKEGLHLICYRTPGAEHVLTVVGSGRNPDVIRTECDRLNEEQVVERRKAMRDKANAIVRDL